MIRGIITMKTKLFRIDEVTRGGCPPLVRSTFKIVFQGKRIQLRIGTHVRTQITVFWLSGPTVY